MVVLKNFPAHPTGSPTGRFVPEILIGAFGLSNLTAVPDARDLASGLHALPRWTISIASTGSAAQASVSTSNAAVSDVFKCRKGLLW